MWYPTLQCKQLWLWGYVSRPAAVYKYGASLAQHCRYAPPDTPPPGSGRLFRHSAWQIAKRAACTKGGGSVRDWWHPRTSLVWLLLFMRKMRQHDNKNLTWLFFLFVWFVVDAISVVQTWKKKKKPPETNKKKMKPDRGEKKTLQRANMKLDRILDTRLGTTDMTTNEF